MTAAATRDFRPVAKRERAATLACAMPLGYRSEHHRGGIAYAMTLIPAGQSIPSLYEESLWLRAIWRASGAALYRGDKATWARLARIYDTLRLHTYGPLD
jgi:hypothetical protein